MHRDEFEFRFKNIEKDLPKKVYVLSSKYQKQINQTCIDCGKKIRHWSDYFCGRCSLIRNKLYNYENISDLGFSTFSDIGTHNYRRLFFYWTQFSYADFVFEDDLIHSQLPQQISLNFKQPKVIYNSKELLYEDTLTLYNWHENYYSVLKHIPDYLLNQQNRLMKIDLIENLNSCGICGYKAVFKNNVCLVCGFGTWTELTERQKKKYSSVEQLNKLSQLRYYLEKPKKFKYPKRESEFEKSPDYKILITKEELKEFKNGK
jgi:ribosomal protein L37E